MLSFLSSSIFFLIATFHRSHSKQNMWILSVLFATYLIIAGILSMNYGPYACNITFEWEEGSGVARGKKNRGPSLLTSQNGAHLTRIFGTNCTTWLVYTIFPYNHGKTLTNTTLLCLNPKHKHRFGKQWVVWMQHIAIGEMKKTWKLFILFRHCIWVSR